MSITLSSLRGFIKNPSQVVSQLFPNLSFNGSILSAFAEQDYLYLGGGFTGISKVESSRMALLSKTDASLVSSVFAHSFNGDINCSVVDGDYIYVGGNFTTYNGITRNRIAKIHIPTGVLDTTFDPGTGFNSIVYSIIVDDTNLYIGGNFTSYKGNVRQYIAKIDKTTAVDVDPTGIGFSTTTGFGSAVYSLLLDGNNLYAGGAFTTYKGLTRQYIAKINKTTAVDADPTGTGFSTTSGFDGAVWSLLLDGNNLYAGGAFITYKGLTRQRIAKIDKTTAAEVDANGTGFSTISAFGNFIVYSLVLDGNNLYVGGSFTTYKGLTRQYIAKIDKTTAAEVDTDGTGFSTTSGFNSTVWSLLLDGNNLYVGGAFNVYKGLTRQRVVKVDKTTAAEVDANGTGFSTTSGFDNTVYTLALSSYGLSVGGTFTYSIGSTIRNRIAKIHIPTGVLDTTFDPGVGFDNSVISLLLDGNNLYVGGQFTTYKTISRGYIVKIDKTTAAEVDADTTGFSTISGFNGIVRSLVLDGNNLYVGGGFNTYKGNTRQYIAKIDKTTAAEVDANGTGFSTTSGFSSTVQSLLLDGNNLYAGGTFTTYKTISRGYIVKIDKTTAAEVDADGTGFSTTTGFNGIVRSLLLDGNSLYVGGDFIVYKGLTRNYIAKIDKTTAAEVDAVGTGFSTVGVFNGAVHSLALDENSLYTGGSFTSATLPNKSNKLALLNKTDGSLVSSVIASNFNGDINCSVVDGDYIYVGGAFTTYNGITRNRIAKIYIPTGALDTTFDPGTGFGAAVQSLLLDGNNLYAGGDFIVYKGLTRQRIAKIDKTTAAEVDADTTGFSTTSGFDNAVISLLLDGNNLYVGGQFTTYKTISRGYIVKIDKTTAAEVDANGTGFSTISGFNGIVRSLVLDGNNLYVGGNFTTYKGITRQRIVKIDKTTAAEVDAVGTGFSTTSGFDNPVFSLLLDGNNLYVGGQFTTYKGSPRQRIANIDKTTAAEVDTSGTGFSTANGFGSGTVYSLALDGNNLYVGGNFTTLSKPNKSNKLTLLNKTDGSLVPSVSSSYFNNDVWCSLVDGDYIYVGGNFTTYNDITRNRIAKIHIPTGALDTTFDPGTGFNSIVYSLVLDGNNLYVGGNFNAYKDITRNRIAKIDKTTAAEVDANGTGFSTISGFDSTVWSLLVDGNNLYAGGIFTTYKGLTRQYIAKINKTTAADSLDFNGNVPNGPIYSLALDGSNLYAGGDFTSMYTPNKSNKLALLNKTDASLVSSVIGSNFNGDVWCSVVDGDYIYVGGDFTSYKNAGMIRIAKIHIPTGALDTTFNPGTGFSGGIVYSLLLDGNNLYVGGAFTTYKGLTRNRIVKIDKTTAAEVDTDGTGFSAVNGFGGAVRSLALDGNNLYVGGDFTGLNILNKSNKLALLNKTDASLVSSVVGSSFSGDVYCSVIDGDYIYVGGNFTSYNGVARNYIAKIHIPTGALDTTFNPGTGFGAAVWSLLLDGTNLYVGGAFTTYKGLTRNRIVKIDKTTAAEVDTDGTGFSTINGFDNIVYSLTLDGNNLYVGGSFTAYKGSSRIRIVKIDKTTAAEVDTDGTGFSTNSGFNGQVWSLVLDGNNLYVGGAFTSYKGATRQYIAKINKITAAEVDTDGTGFSTTSGFNSGVNRLLLDGNNLYAGGGFTTYKGVSRPYLVKIDKTTAAEVDTSGTGFSTTSTFNSGVWSLAIDGNNLYVGGTFSNYKSLIRQYIVKIDKTTAAEVDTSGTGFSTTAGFDTGTVYTLALSSYGLNVGGTFTAYKTDFSLITRQRIAKIDKTTAAEIDANGTGFSTTNGFGNAVYSLLLDGNNLYVGGNFTTYKGNTRQRIAKIDKTTAAEVDANGTGFSTTSGFSSTVQSLLLDGNNLYAGGAFNSYKGVSRPYLVKIDKTTAAEVDANGTGFSTISGFGGTVVIYSLLIDGNNLYVGGSFTSYKGATRQYIAKIDKTTAAEVDTNGTGFSTTSGFSGTVYTLALSSYGLNAGGAFTSYKTDIVTFKQRKGIVKINKTTTAEVDTDGTGFSTTGGFGGVIYSLALDGNNLYVGGAFTTYKGLARNRIVKIDKTTASEVDTNGTGFSTTSGFDNTVRSIALDGNNLYVGGNFITYKGITRQRIVKIDKTTAAEVDTSGTGFSTTSGFDNIIYTLALSLHGLSVGGGFSAYKTDVGSVTRQRIAKINKTTAAEVDADGTGFSTTSGFNNPIYMLKMSSYGLSIGGVFTNYASNINSTATTSRYLCKIDKNNKQVDVNFNTPVGSNAVGTTIVYSMIINSNRIYVGGTFTNKATNYNVNNYAIIKSADGSNLFEKK